jgi:protein-disulfide isomerase
MIRRLRFAIIVCLAAGSLSAGAATKTTTKKAVVAKPTIAEQEKALGAANPNSDRVRVLVAPDDPVLGPDDAQVTVVEVADYESPFTAKLAELPFELQKAFGDKVRFVWKSLPIVKRDEAVLAAQAALAAGAQGKYWEYHAVLFTNRTALDRASLEKYADALGLDMTAFKAALDHGTYAQIVTDQAAYATQIGVTGIPMTFVNGKPMSGAMPIDSFKTAVSDELTKTDELLKNDAKLDRAHLYAKLMKDARAKVNDKSAVAAAPAVQPGQLDPSKIYAIPVGTSPQRGSADAKLTLIAFEDFKCPFCQRAQPTLVELQKRYGKEIRIVFKHLVVHETARGLHIGAAAAAEQGKFWELHDYLFQDISKTDAQDIEDYAKSVGVDVKRFEATIDSKRPLAAIDTDAKLAAQFNTHGTPTFFINGRPILGAQPIDKFTAVCDAELARADDLLKKGVKRADLYAALIKGGEQLVVQPPKGQTGPILDKTVYAVPVGNSPMRGASDAKLTVVMFTEFRCPFCAKLQPTLAELAKKYGKDIRFVHKAYVVHGSAAQRLHMAALAAGEQGKYWEMHDKLFAGFPDVDDAKAEELAQGLGLDMKKWKADLTSDALAQKIDADMKQGDALGVRGVPIVFINGRRIFGALPLDEIVPVADEELAKANEAIKNGTKPSELYDQIVKGGQTHL